MISLRKISFYDLQPYVELGFANDEDLLKKYAIFDTSTKHCVDGNMKNIVECLDIFEFQYYIVMNDQSAIGFTVVSKADSFLFSFGINIQSRKKDILIAWMDKVKQLLDNDFTTVLWDKNKRAIEFMQKNGFVIYDRKNKATYLKFSK
jgi:hypothetical protein